MATTMDMPSGSYPVTFDRVKASKKARPEQQIIVIDPRHTPTAACADIFLPVAPGGDIALLNALGRLLLLTGASDDRIVAEHTRGLEDYRRFLMEQDLAELCSAAGVTEAVLYRLARLIGGEILVRSTVGEGSTFSLTIPMYCGPSSAICATLTIHPSIADPEHVTAKWTPVPRNFRLGRSAWPIRFDRKWL